jgi:hypothetical protein
MEIIIKIKDSNSIKLSIFCEKKEVDSLEWKDKNNLSRNLLKKIDVLLSNNKVGVDKISGYKIISDVPDSWTTYRIAKITLESLMLAKKIGL